MTTATNLADVNDNAETRAFPITREQVRLFKLEGHDIGVSLTDYLLKEDKKRIDPSKQGVTTGRKEHPFNMHALTSFQASNAHHSACILAKTTATVGLGFRKPGEKPVNQPTGNPDRPPLDPVKAMIERQKPSKCDMILNPLTDHSWQDVLNDICEDFWQVGNGYMEVIRAGNGDKITGLHHIPAKETYVYLENEQYDRHFEIVGSEGAQTNQHFAKWFDKDGLIKRVLGGTATGLASFTGELSDKKSVSEVIHFRRSTSLSRWYGFPDWLAAVSSIELVQCLQQYKYDFFLNRGVPEFMLFVTGAKMEKADWDKIEQALKANIGLGNSHKSLAVNLPNKEITITLVKLAQEGKESDDFTKTKENLALEIVSAHRVPPLLAGIQIPGKLGANNELPNALMSFQVLVVQPAQRLFQQVLAQTLGNPEQNGRLGLTAEDFLFRTITEEIDVGTLETQSRMRQTVRDARAEGRDMSEGLKD